jgi:hypothetical protein
MNVRQGLSIVGKYDSASVILESMAPALRDLSQAIREIAETTEFSLALPSIPPTPYLGYVKSLKIEKRTGNVYVSRIEDQVSISGSPEKLKILAQNIDHLAEHQSKPDLGNYEDHVHIEFYPGHFYVHEESMPLVLTRRASTV